MRTLFCVLLLFSTSAMGHAAPPHQGHDHGHNHGHNHGQHHGHAHPSSRPTKTSPKQVVTRTLTPAERKIIYWDWFKAPYAYMFETKQPVLTLRGKRWGRYTGGVQGLTSYGALYSGFAALLKAPSPSFGDASIVRKLAGITPYKHKPSSYVQPAHINPAIIKWGIANLIPHPKAKLGKHTYLTIYQKLFAPCFRMYALSYLYAQQKLDLGKETKAYLAFATKPRADGTQYLAIRFGTLPLKASVSQDYGLLTPALALGFWLRRHNDKTDKLLWQGLQKLLKQYDPTWLKQQLARKWKY